MANLLFDLPCDIQDIIFRKKHQMEAEEYLNEIPWVAEKKRVEENFEYLKKMFRFELPEEGELPEEDEPFDHYLFIEHLCELFDWKNDEDVWTIGFSILDDENKIIVKNMNDRFSDNEDCSFLVERPYLGGDTYIFKMIDPNTGFFEEVGRLDYDHFA